MSRIAFDIVEQDGIVEFLRLQMQAHHPGGAKTTDDGAFAVDWDLWKASLGCSFSLIVGLFRSPFYIQSN